MPEEYRLVDGFFLHGGIAAVTIDHELETVDDVHRDEMEPITVELGLGEDFLELSPEDVHHIAIDLASNMVIPIYESMMVLRDELRLADELVTVIERAEEGDQDWEV